MLCYRCGSHVPDAAETCEKCGQRLVGGPKGAVSIPPRRRVGGELEGAPFKVGDLLAGRFRIKAAIGKGPLGFVYRAADEQLDGDVAIKLLQPKLLQAVEERAHFSKVIRTSRKFVNPMLGRVLEDGDHDGWPFYTTAFFDGLSLRKVLEPRLARGHLFSLKELEPIFVQLAEALDAAHAVGAHGNLKPENVFILPDVLKVTDFALGKALPRRPFIQALKPGRGDRYLAPEFLAGEEIDARADVYALGVILGEMLTGQLPDGVELPELRQKARDLPLSVEGIYRRALNQSPQARFASAGELVRELFAPPTRAELPAVSSPPREKPPTTELPANDLTVPISEEELAQRLGRLAPSSPKASPPPSPPPARQAQIQTAPVVQTRVAPQETVELRAPGHRVPPPPPPPGEGPTIAMSALPPEALSVPMVSSASAASKQIFRAARGKQVNQGMLLLVVLVVAGLGVGVFFGLWLVNRLHAHPVVASPQLVHPPLAPAPPASTAPAPAPSTPSVVPDKAEAPPIETRRHARSQTRSASAKVELSCPEGMSLIPAGPFKLGTARDDPMMGFDEKALTTVDLRAFCIDGLEYPGHRGQKPKVKVSWSDARHACEARHARLCSESEWEKACKGPSEARYPYGNAFDAAACATEDAAGHDRSLAGAGQYARCRSGYGVMDLSGNAAEWTASGYGGASKKAVKGGAFDKPDYAARCSARKSASPSARFSDVGFRCCADPSR